MLLPLKFHSFIIEAVNVYDEVRTFIAHKTSGFAEGYQRRREDQMKTDDNEQCACMQLQQFTWAICAHHSASFTTIGENTVSGSRVYARDASFLHWNTEQEPL